MIDTVNPNADALALPEHMTKIIARFAAERGGRILGENGGYHGTDTDTDRRVAGMFLNRLSSCSSTTTY